jgi:hypothetical protein
MIEVVADIGEGGVDVHFHFLSMCITCIDLRHLDFLYSFALAESQVFPRAVSKWDCAIGCTFHQKKRVCVYRS